MQETRQLRAGMPVVSADGVELGTLEAFDGDDLHVAGLHIPPEGVDRVEAGTVYLKHEAAAYTPERYGAGETVAARGEVRVPLAEEQLTVEKRTAEQGEVRVEKHVTEERQTVPVTLRREAVHVERRETNERPLRPGEAQDAFQEETIQVPLRGEQAVAHKQAVVTGEVVVDKEQATEREQVSGTVRREHVHVDEDQSQTQSRG